MEKYFDTIPPNMINFCLVAVFSLLIGLSQRKLQMRKEESQTASFGSDRTFTLIGILGYILYILDPENLTLYSGGGILLMLIIGISYFFKLYYYRIYGITSIVIALITYCLAPLVCTQPSWFYLLVVVVVLLLTEMKESFSNFAKRMNNDEMITLSKFILISGIILPILPKDEIIEGINLTAYNIWLATVVVSAVSYASYLLNKFVFRDSGIIISGIISGLYSSTAATLVLAKKSRESGGRDINQYIAAIIFATAMMYIRVLVLIAIFNADLLKSTWHYFVIMFIVSMAVGIIAYFYKHSAKKQDDAPDSSEIGDKNPLEFKVALIFAVLFVLFTIITHYTIEYLGTSGLTWLSVIVGVSDVSPFLINLFQGGYSVAISAIAIATFSSLISNNVVKLIYAIAFTGKKAGMRKELAIAFTIITVVNVILLLFI